MSNYYTKAITIKTYNLGEADKIVVIYSSDYGIIRCVAKGVKKSTSKIGGKADILVASKFFLAKGKNLDIICQAELEDSFAGLRKDINKLTYAMYCAELITTFGVENDIHSKEIYNIFFDCLKNMVLSSTTEEILWIVIKFKLTLMKLIGYGIELNQCVKCNDLVKDNKNLFCIESGGVVCKQCQSSSYKIVDLPTSFIRVFKDASYFDFSFDNGEKVLDQFILKSCFNILRDYILFRSHKKFKTTELVDSLF